MIVETVITSVPRGLKAGRTGYQPVMRTRGLRDDVLRQLEPLTGYRHIHRQGSGKNPLNYTYRRLTSNVGDLAVLGRTVDAGSDFSNRSNKCGHLVAFTADEIGRLSRSTPAALLADNQALFASQWTKGPEERPAPPALAAQPQTPAICTTWQSQFGDAGWAAVVAERARRRQPTLLVAPDSSPLSSDLLLRLIREATGLLPPADRWAVSFETTVLGASDALIQGTYRGSPEAEAARQGVLVLPLGGPVPPGQLQENDLCKLARFGPPKPAAAAPPPVAPTTTVPNAADDFLSNAPTAPTAGSPPPLLPSAPNRRVGSFEPLPEEKRVPWGTIIGASVAFLLIAFGAAWFAIASTWSKTVEKNKPPQQNDNAQQDGQADLPPQDVLSNYLSAFHQEKRPANLTEPSIGVWQQWLKARIAEEKINEEWASYANAVLRYCTAPDTSPFAGRWKQKERAFYDAVQHISQAEPIASELDFLLVVTNALADQAGVDKFVQAALDRYKKRSPEKTGPDDIIKKIKQTNNFHRQLVRFLAQEQREQVPNGQAAPPSAKELADAIAENQLPEKTAKQFFIMLSKSDETRASVSDPNLGEDGNGDDTIEFNKLASKFDEFSESLAVLQAFAADSDQDIPTDPAPRLSDYKNVFGTLEPSIDVRHLNAALQKRKEVPSAAAELTATAQQIMAWEYIDKNFGTEITKHDTEDHTYVLIKGIPYFDAIRDSLAPHIELPEENSFRSPETGFWTTNYKADKDEEPLQCCSFKTFQNNGKVNIAVSFPDKTFEIILQRVPFFLENTVTKARTKTAVINGKPLEYEYTKEKSPDKNPSVAKFAEQGEKVSLEIIGTDKQASVRLPDLFKTLGAQQIRPSYKNLAAQDFSLLPLRDNKQEKPSLKFSMSLPATKINENPQDNEVSVTAESEIRPDWFEGKLTFGALGDRPIEDAKGEVDKGVQENLLKYQTKSAKPIIIQLLERMRGAQSFKEIDALQADVSFIANHHDFRFDGSTFGQNDNLLPTDDSIFPSQDFTAGTDGKVTQTNRPLLGQAGFDKLEQRSWEIVFASFLVKASHKYQEKQKKDYEEVYKNLETIENGIGILRNEIADLRKEKEKNKKKISEKNAELEKREGEQKALKNEQNRLKSWFTEGWIEDVKQIVRTIDPAKVKLPEKSKLGINEKKYREHVKLCKDLYLGLRPFVARYLLAFHNDAAQKVKLDSLVEITLTYTTPGGQEIEIAKIGPPPNTSPETPAGKETGDPVSAPKAPASSPK